ncbi:MAG: type I DNA topoisomerase [Candidatus Kerfeldbacteria bacterium]|nr:type I DNA topoisomerase [Candidatus Kerfeldbacteria bacterium]
MSTSLVIVESPTKAKTLSKFLGKEYTIDSSYGHVRDLPKSTMGIDTEHDFSIHYVIPSSARERVKTLKAKAKKAQTVYFATDEDREGEAIAWHLQELLDLPAADKAKRIVFHEITKDAVLEALKNPRAIDMHLVDAQQARRALDRLVGYELSPWLWKKIRRGLSAGRVQSVAVRLIVEREREIQAFKPQEYWTIEADFAKANGESFRAKLAKKDGKVLDKLQIGSKEAANTLLRDLENAAYSVVEVEKKERRKNPLPPYTTSTLQQDANYKLGFSSKQTMLIAQQLYEGINLGNGSEGLITYMRTDSVNLATKFTGEAKAYIAQAFGKEYALDHARAYKAKSKLAQEAHEAIRPTEAHRSPESIQSHLDARQFKLYNLIWRRALASQMAEARFDATTIDVANDKTPVYTFRATGSVITFPGYLALYTDLQKDTLLPECTTGEKVTAQKISPEQHFTEPPARYSEATLVKALEEDGIGRPSTYAPTMSTIVDRGYVEKEEKRFKPTEIGFLVNDVLVEHFPQIVDLKFTARMEDELDEIANGDKEWEPTIREFYQPFKKNLLEKEESVSKKALTEEATDEVCPKCGKPMVIKMGRFGRFLACTGYPECKTTKPIGADGKPAEPEVTDEKCPECGSPMEVKRGRYGAFLGCTKYPDCKGIKKIEKVTGVKCPQCGKGDIVEKRSRRGKTFFACNQYPACKFALWSKPTGEKCPTCGSLLLYAAKNTVKCSSKDCSYTAELPL